MNFIQLGYPPVRIDMLSKLTGLTTNEIWRAQDLDGFGRRAQAQDGQESQCQGRDPDPRRS